MKKFASLLIGLSLLVTYVPLAEARLTYERPSRLQLVKQGRERGLGVGTTHEQYEKILIKAQQERTRAEAARKAKSVTQMRTQKVRKIRIHKRGIRGLVKEHEVEAQSSPNFDEPRRSKRRVLKTRFTRFSKNPNVVLPEQPRRRKVRERRKFDSECAKFSGSRRARCQSEKQRRIPSAPPEILE